MGGGLVPYIITTTQPMPIDGTPGDGSTRRAVATLEEAQETAHVRAQSGGVSLVPAAVVLAIAGLPESGGTIGPLLDGTVIEVERVTWYRVARGGNVHTPNPTALRADRGDESTQHKIIDAFNVRSAA